MHSPWQCIFIHYPTLFFFLKIKYCAAVISKDKLSPFQRANCDTPTKRKVAVCIVDIAVLRIILVKLLKDFPLDEPQSIGEERKKEFIALLGAILRMRNLLVSFDEFEGKEIISERDFQDYLGRYQDLRDEWKARRERGELTDIDDDIVFEIELIKQIEINIDYILMLVTKYHDSHCTDKEVLITIQKAVDSSSTISTMLMMS